VASTGGAGFGDNQIAFPDRRNTSTRRGGAFKRYSTVA